MKLNRARTFAAACLVALAAVGTAAQARDNVYWSLGVEAAPGVSLGVGNVRPVYVAPPVYIAPQPIYVAPRPVVIAPAPVYYARPAPVYYGYGQYYSRPGKHKGHHKHSRQGRRDWD
jgi:hypothetical protein